MIHGENGYFIAIFAASSSNFDSGRQPEVGIVESSYVIGAQSAIYPTTTTPVPI